MELSDLDDLIYNLGFEPSDEQIKVLYAEFERDFVNNPFYIDGLKVKVIMVNSIIPEFNNFPETFVHLITRKSGSYKRVFDKHRANKIHWVKCILENRKEPEIIFFQYPDDDGDLRDYYWYKEADFLVIMQQITPDYLIITSFCIDDERNRKFYEKRLKWYVEKEKQ